MDVRGKRELRRKRNPLVCILAVLLAAGGLFAAWFFFLRPFGHGHDPHAGREELAAPQERVTSAMEPVLPEKAPEAHDAAETARAAEKSEAQNQFVVSLLGDCTLASSHYTNHFESVVGDDLAYPFSNVAEILTEDDLTLANLECSFSPRRLESESEYAFCGDPKYARSLALGGVDCVSMANNHTNDFGRSGVEDTAAVLEKEGINGIREDQGSCFDLEHEDGTSVRIGIYAHPFNGSEAQMKSGVARLREEGADIVIACMHAGAERIYVPTKRQTALAHAAINGGADLVVGTHPHILQPAEAYHGGTILYSIGNFCFGGNRNPGDKDTVIAQLVVRVEKGDISWDVEYLPCGVSSVANRNDYRPTPYEQGTAGYQRCLKKLAEPWDKTTAEEAAAAKAAAEAPEKAAGKAAADGSDSTENPAFAVVESGQTAEEYDGSVWTEE